MPSDQSVEKCVGPIKQRNNFGLIPQGYEPTIRRTTGEVECRYLQPNGSCSAIKDLLPEILRICVNKMANVERDLESAELKQHKRLQINLRTIRGDLARVAAVISSPPACRFRDVKSG